MTVQYCWSNFYQALNRYGPGLLTGIDDEDHLIIEEISRTSDMFWSTSLQEMLSQGAENGSVIEGVLIALEEWRQNIFVALDENFGIILDRQNVVIDVDNPIIDKLVEAARP
jgi:hypothetical protein